MTYLRDIAFCRQENYQNLNFKSGPVHVHFIDQTITQFGLNFATD